MAGENVLIHRDQGGSAAVLESGATLTLKSGATLSAESGSTLTLAGTVSLTGTLSAVGDDGSAPGSGITAAESGDVLHKTVITIAKAVTMTDATTNGCHGTVPIYTFPQAAVGIVNAYADLGFTAGSGGIADTAALIYAVGSDTVGTGNSTLTTVEADVVGSTAATLTGGTVASIAGACAAPVVLNGLAAAKSLNLNLAVPDAGSSGNDTITVAGTVTVLWR